MTDAPPSGSADLIVIGAGVMGAWTALQACRSGRRTTLIDAYGTGHLGRRDPHHPVVARLGSVLQPLVA